MQMPAHPYLTDIKMTVKGTIEEILNDKIKHHKEIDL